MKGNILDLWDYRRRVAELYRVVREYGTNSDQAFSHFRRERDDLFRNHPQSPLSEEQKAAFDGLSYYDYDPAFCVTARIEPAADSQVYEISLGADQRLGLRQFGQVSFELPSGSGTLGLFWITGYGGGVFLPFRDATNARDTYGGGRYLYDTIKGADLGMADGQMVLDFNYAYHPSCSHNPRWICPLAPPQNKLHFPITAGERLMTGQK